MKEYDIINKILIDLTDAIGWTGQGKQMEEFVDARNKLLALVDHIDSDKLEKAKDHIMFLLPMAKGYAYPTNIKANLEMIKNAEEFIKSNAVLDGKEGGNNA
jgi:hypothetical protein